MLSTTNFISLQPCPTQPFPSSSSSSLFLPFNFSLLFPSSPSKITRFTMSAHHSNSPLPDDRIIVGVGGATMDYLVMVDGFPKPDEKIKGTSCKVQGGGNVGNALTCTARLGLRPRIIAKVAEDAEGRGILEELEADGVDTSFIVVSEEGRSMYSYVIVDSIMKTRTAIYYPGYPPLTPTDFSGSSLSSVLDGANLVYSDGLSLKTASVVAREVSDLLVQVLEKTLQSNIDHARRRGIPILVDAEMGEEGFDDLLKMSDYAVCSAKYPQAWTNAPSMASALVSMLMRLPLLKFVIVTLGEEGCIMLQRSHKDDARLEEMNVDQCLASLNEKKDSNTTYATCISSPVLKLEAPGVGTLCGRLLVGTAERIPHLELVDTTGAGDAFIGAVLYDMLPEKILPFAAQVAAGCCRAFGARTGLPHITDPRLQPFLDQNSITSPAQ